MLIRATGDKHLNAKTVLFDSWYAAADNLKLIVRLGLYFVTTLKSNRMVSLTPEGGYLHLQDLVWTADALEHGLSVRLKDLPFRVQLFRANATVLPWMKIFYSQSYGLKPFSCVSPA
jgi:hypothetical protein